MGFTLSVNTNPFVNRFAEPEDLIATLGDEIGIAVDVERVHAAPLRRRGRLAAIARERKRAMSHAANGKVDAINSPACSAVNGL